MELTLKEKLYLYKDFIKLYEQLQSITLTLYLINANINSDKCIEICIDRMERTNKSQLNIIKKILIDKLNIKDKLNKKIHNNITLENILEL